MFVFVFVFVFVIVVVFVFVSRCRFLIAIDMKMYGFEGVCLSEVQFSISELSVVDLVGGGWVGGWS